MKLNILSDLHLSLGALEIPRNDADVVVLAGDVARPREAVSWASGFAKPVLYVPGNHEFYGGSIAGGADELKQLCAGTNIRLLDKGEVIIDGVRFLGTTLWTDFLLFGEGDERTVAALMLGAQGALIGTRFYASAEALGQDRAKQRIVAARGDQTARTRVFDVIRGYPWPPIYTGRAIRNGFMERWDGRENHLANVLETERVGYQAATRDGDFDTAVVWAGECVDLIKSVESASALVARIGAEAEAQLRAGAALAR